MGYLICQKCKGYYKLKPGEKPEDFTDVCACGGKLIYKSTIEGSNHPNSSNKIESKGKNDKKNKERSIFGIPQEKTGKLIILLIITVVLYVIWIPAGLVFFGCVIGLWWDWRNNGLISCPDCGHHISKKAEVCPKCGYPIN